MEFDAEARRIALAGQAFVRQHASWSSVLCYWSDIIQVGAARGAPGGDSDQGLSSIVTQELTPAEGAVRYYAWGRSRPVN